MSIHSILSLSPQPADQRPVRTRLPRRAWRLTIAAALIGCLLVNSADAFQGMLTPKLHVAGRFLQDASGNQVTLHGYMQPSASWFNGEGHNFRDPSDFTSAANVAPALNFLNGVTDLMTHTGAEVGQAHGWYSTFVRVIGDDGGVSNFAPGWDVSGALANSAQFNGWIENMLVPYINHCRADGLYVVICGNPSVAYPGGDVNKNMTQQYQQNLITFWNAVAANPSIKSADNVMFEICNEPITIETSFGAGDWGSANNAHWAALARFMQPIVDAIRASGADNIILLPGLGWQGEYQGFPANPVTGTNLGYAAHIYPAYGVAHDDQTKVNRLWASNYKPAADQLPMVVTEMMWQPNDGTGYQDLWNASTAGFGIAVKGCLDTEGNVSYLIGMAGDVVGNINAGLANATAPTVQGAQAAFAWWTTYLRELPPTLWTPPSTPSRLTNISTRSFVGIDSNVQIAGFNLVGGSAESVLIRASGPALNAIAGLPGCLADPQVELHDQGSGTALVTVDDWDASLAPTFAQVGAFGWTTGSKDAALLRALTPGSYTVLVKGADAGTGTALVEVYDAGGAGSRLMNISTRSFVGTDSNVQIAGFTITGGAPKTVLIRAAGPALNAIAGIDGYLADPEVELHEQGTTTLMATNDNWDASLSATFSRLGAFGWTTGSKDAALVATLIPGSYSVIVKGNGGGTGTALVEVYDAD